MVKNWGLAIGINQYEFLQPLKYAKRDAQLMQELFRNQAGFERVFLFSDEEPNLGETSTHPSRANLLQLLQQLSEQPFLQPGDNFWFFFSGHGMVHANSDYLMPCDGNPEDIENTGISINFIIECLRNCGTDNIVLILDACRHQNQNIGEGIGQQTQQIASQTKAISIFSCSPDEYSYEIDALQKGVFTHALLEGLGTQGQCATVERLNQYLSFRVPQLVHQYQNAQQTPYIVAEPKNKSRQILIPKYATLHDIATLKIDAFRAEVDGNLELAEQLWMQVNATTSFPDMDAIKAMQRIAQLRTANLYPNTNLTHQLYSLRENGIIGSTLLEEQNASISNYERRGLLTIPEISENASNISIYKIEAEQQRSKLINLYCSINTELSSEQAVIYKRLRDLLAAGKWKESDRETMAIMLKVAAREKKGWLNVESINQFSCTDLYTIDQLWLKYSNGRFGFSVQKRIWENIGGQPDADYETWCQFSDRIGWRVNNNWLFYSDLTFSENAPEGHFPAAGVVNILTAWRGWVVGSFSCLVGFSAFASRLAKCDL